MAIAQPSIRSGREIGAESAPRLALVPRAAPPSALREAGAAAATGEPPAPAAPTPEYRAVHDRLSALERLARLAAQGALSPSEFAAEKARLIRPPAGEPAPAEAAPPAPERGPSLLGRLFDWRLIPAGLAAGLAFSFATQRQETLRFVDETLRLFGA